MKSRTKKSPTPTTAKSNGAGLQVDTPKRSGKSVPATLALDPHQTEAVALLAERLGGTTDEVLEFLVTLGLFALGMDECAHGRVCDGVGRIFEGSELAGKVKGELADLNCNLQNEGIADFLTEQMRPRMAGDWRGTPVPAEAGA